MSKKVIVSVIIILMVLINSLNVFGITAKGYPIYELIYNETNLIISIVMKVIMFLLIGSYIIFAIVYIMKSKKDRNEKVKKLIKLLIITIIISLGLWFGSEKVKTIGMIEQFAGYI